MSDPDLSTLRVRYVTAPEGGATIVKFDQYIDGIQLFDTEIAVALTRANEVSGVSGRMYGQVEEAPDPQPGSRCRLRALSPLLSRFDGRIVSPADFEKLTTTQGADMQNTPSIPDRNAGSSPFFSEATRIKAVLFPLASGQFVPAYYLELLTEGNPSGTGPSFSYVIDAETADCSSGII